MSQREQIAAVHELKTWPEYFQEVEAGRKTFEIRKNDRGFKVGDTLWLREYTPGVGLTGRDCRRVVSYLTDYEQQPGYVVMALSSSSTPGQEEWQPIETALKDGTWVVIGWFEFPGQHHYTRAFWHTHKGGRWCDTHTEWSGRPHQTGPTHWRPDRPSPPLEPSR
jgi:hypothetical protein